MTLQQSPLHFDMTLLNQENVLQNILSHLSQPVTRFTLKWPWQPFHELGLQAIKTAEDHGVTGENFERFLTTLSAPAAPKNLSLPKNFATQPKIIDADGRLIPLDPEIRIRTTYDEVRKETSLPLKATTLMGVSALKTALIQKQTSMIGTRPSSPWQPVIELMQEHTTLTNILTAHPLLVEKFHGLSPWEQLEFIECIFGVQNPFTVLHFQCIYEVT